jgi:superfamily II DNA or RNA helicase
VRWTPSYWGPCPTVIVRVGVGRSGIDKRSLLGENSPSLHASAVLEEPCKSFTPRVYLYAERMWVSRGEGSLDQGREELVPVISLCFDYGGVQVRAADRRQRFFVAEGSGMGVVERNLRGEAAAQCLLEGFGAIELGCLDDVSADLDSDADYLVQLDGNVHSYCSFTAYALPQLRALGWIVEVDAGYPYQVVETDAPWYASIQPDEERTDWFGLELGIQVDGKRVNVLPALLGLLEECPDAESLEALLDMPARLRVVPVGENRYLPIPPDRLRAVMQVLLELYRGERLAEGSLRFPRTLAPSVAKLDAALGDSARLLWAGMTSAIESARGLKAPAALGPPPVGLAATLRPYQEVGVEWLAALVRHEAGGVLADDMGLGKTLQTIAHLVRERASGRADLPSLVVCPTSLVGNWQRELGKFAPGLRVVVVHGPRREGRFGAMSSADVVLTTYPILVKDLESFQKQGFHLVILDEAQAIKNPRALASQSARQLSARHRLCLSGTPVENNLEELWSLFDFLMPGFLGDLQRFRTHFRIPIERAGNHLKLEALRNAVSPFILRRMKEHVARDLPPKTEIVRPVELSDDQRELYESIRVAAHGDVRRAIREKGVTGSAIAILDALMKLRQVCCDPRLVNVPSARRVSGSAKLDCFFELLKTQLEQGRRVLVFSQFTRMLDLIANGLDERGHRFVELTGKTQDRQRAVDRFEGREVDLFLISLKAGGTGLNLTSADTVVHYDPWWNAASQAQATDRAYRIGQTRPVFVYNLIAAGSVEERMLRLQQRKSELASSLLGLTNAPQALSEGDVDDLFAPLGD